MLSHGNEMLFARGKSRNPSVLTARGSHRRSDVFLPLAPLSPRWSSHLSRDSSIEGNIYTECVPTTDREFSIEETRCVLQGGLPMPVEIGPAGRVGSSYKTRSQTPLPVTSLYTKTHQPSFFHGVLPQEPLRCSSSLYCTSETGRFQPSRIEIRADSRGFLKLVSPKAVQVLPQSQWCHSRNWFSRYSCCSWLRTVSPFTRFLSSSSSFRSVPPAWRSLSYLFSLQSPNEPSYERQRLCLVDYASFKEWGKEKRSRSFVRIKRFLPRKRFELLVKNV